MTVNRTTLLDLPLPVTGTESGTWGDTTNNGLTQYLDIAIAGTLVLSTDADVTLTSTEGDSSATNIGATTAQYAILRWTATGSTTRNITALAQSKTYVVINATGGTQSIVLRGAGPTTGVTIISGEKALCVWNGSDFVKVSSSAAAGGSNTQVQYNSSGVLAGSSNMTFDGTSLTLGGNPTLSAGTANGVLYLNGSKVATSGSALTFDGSNLALGMSALAARVMTVRGRVAFVAPSNDSQLAIYSDGTTNGIYSTYNSGGSYLPMTFYTSDVERYRIGTDGTAIWTIGSEQMRLTSTGLGIGTSSPGYKLDVAGVVRSDSWIGRSNTSAPTADAFIYRPSDNTLGFGTANTLRLTLDSSGNLGLGVTPSAWSGPKVVQVGNYAAVSSSGAYGGSYSSNAYYDGTNWKYITTDSATRYDQVSGTHSWRTAASGTAGNLISFTQARTLNTNGALVLQGGDTAASGVGVTFPATQSASSNANTLDDYEEGTWTPTFETTGTGFSAISYGTRDATYTKVGRLVTVACRIETTSVTKGSASGNVRIGGLPFTVQNRSTSYSGSGASYDFLSNRPVVFQGVPNNTTIQMLYSTASTNDPVEIVIADISTTGANQVRCSFTYEV